LGILPVPVGSADLASVLVLRGQPLRVAPEAGRVDDPELLGDLGHRIGRDVEGISKEGTQGTDRPQLSGEAETVMVAASLVDQRPVDVVEIEAMLQLRSARWIDEASVARGLVVAEELDGHAV
jgi:hypothetical protein